MSARAAELATRLRVGVEEVAALARGCPDERWQQRCEGTGWTVGAVVRHIAFGLDLEEVGGRALVNGDPLPAIYQSRQALDEMNDAQAERFAQEPREETIADLEAAARSAESFVAGLTDEQLAIEGRLPLLDTDMTVEQFVERIMVGHIHGHLPALRAALGGTEGSAS